MSSFAPQRSLQDAWSQLPALWPPLHTQHSPGHPFARRCQAGARRQALLLFAAWLQHHHLSAQLTLPAPAMTAACSAAVAAAAAARLPPAPWPWCPSSRMLVLPRYAVRL